MKKFLYKKLIKDWPFIRNPLFYDGIFQVIYSNDYLIGIGFYIGKKHLRQGIKFYVPLFIFNLYIHSQKKAMKIFKDKLNSE